MAGTYADTLEFSPEGVSNTVKLLEEIRVSRLYRYKFSSTLGNR